VPIADAEARELDIEGAARQVGVELAPTPGDVAARADILSVHLALGRDTRGLVGAEVLGRLRPGAVFINTARGEIVDEVALGEAVRARNPRGARRLRERAGGRHGRVRPSARLAARRVRHAPHRRVHEPGAGGHCRRDGPHHPHLQGHGTRAERREPGDRTPATHMLVVRHRDRPGVLAHVFAHLRQAGLNVQETENVVFEGAEAAVARINLDGAAVGGRTCANMRTGSSDIFDLQVVKLDHAGGAGSHTGVGDNAEADRAARQPAAERRQGS
jgi:D-3-phosphoglycerate dehydrogenase / 2-oxoglutarate reductase